MHDALLLLLLAGLIVFCLWVGINLLSPGARLERRRRKSHSRIVPKTSRPMVKFSVRTPKK